MVLINLAMVVRVDDKFVQDLNDFLVENAAHIIYIRRANLKTKLKIVEEI